MGTIIPSIFLSVAAFLLNVVLSRIIALQRDQIAALKDRLRADVCTPRDPQGKPPAQTPIPATPPGERKI